MNDPGTALQMRGISKSFPGVKALDDVSLEVRKGEVHVLLGENGAGKSTLMKILSGVYTMDSGDIALNGSPVQINGIKDSQALGISIIHQELNMLAERTIAQNIFMGREPLKSKFFGWVDINKMRTDSKVLLESLGVNLSPDTMVKDLSIAQQQMVEVVKALSIETKILIMDEPTSSLTQKEIDSLFTIVNRLRDAGISIIYISHRMEEIYRIGDRVTVMRDGKIVDTVDVKNSTMDSLVTMMVGRKIEKFYNRSYNKPGGAALRTENLSGLRFRNINIEVKCGEIVGIAGLVGAGRTELVKAIYGYDGIDSGKIFINGKEKDKHTPKDSVMQGIGFLPEDRKNEGLVLDLPIKNNITQASLWKLFKKHVLDDEVELEVATQYHKEMRIASPDVERPVVALSGGNQQKVVLSKWLCTGCELFIFDEPTRGIDVGAKTEIYELMNRLAAQGCAILVISSDQMELLGISDRIYVMSDGEIKAHFTKEEATVEKIVAYAVGNNDKEVKEYA